MAGPEAPVSSGPSTALLNDNLSRMAAGTEGSLLDDLGNKLSSLLSKLSGFFPNFSNPQQAGLKGMDSQGLQDKMMNGAAKSLSTQRDNSIGSKLAKHLSRDSAQHSQEVATISHKEPHIEAPAPQPDFHALVGDPGGHGKYSVADVAGHSSSSNLGIGGSGRGMTLDA